MADCDVCGESIETPIECEYCGEQFCFDHRLPDDHDCPAYVSSPTPEPEKTESRAEIAASGHRQTARERSRSADSSTANDRSSRRRGSSDDGPKLYETLPEPDDPPEPPGRELPFRLEPILLTLLVLLILTGLYFGDAVQFV